MKSTIRKLDPTKTHTQYKGLCALGVMTKAPLEGMVKTRLVPPLTPAEAAGLNAAFLKDTANNIASVCKSFPAVGVAVYTPQGEEGAFNPILPDSFTLLSQRGDGFGARLFHAAEDLLSAGFNSLCLIDSDSPTLPGNCLERAVSALNKDGDRVVLGPCDDGGYYLIGLKVAHRPVFENIEWSTSRVLAQTINHARTAGLEIEMLPPWYDVDDEPTLVRLCNELLSGGTNEPGFTAPHTAHYLKNLVAAHGDDLWAPEPNLTETGV